MTDDSPNDLAQVLLNGAQTLVDAMADDGWKMFKQRFGGLVAGHEKRLDTTHDRLTAASPADAETVRDAEVQAWKGRLTDSVEDDPALVADLRSVIAEVGPQVRTTVGTNSGQIVSATGDASVLAVMSGRDSHVHDNRKTFKFFITPFESLGHVAKALWKMAGIHPAAATLSAVVAAGLVTTGAVVAAHAGAAGSAQTTATISNCFGADLEHTPAVITNVCAAGTPNADKVDIEFGNNALQVPQGIPALARWTGSTSPTATDCQRLLSGNPAGSETPLHPGDEFCLGTHDGGFAFLRLTAVSPIQATLTAEVFTP